MPRWAGPAVCRRLPGVDLPSDILERRPEEAARRIALGFLDRAGSELERLADPEDDEALHDFRTALRRLRSTVRAWAPALGKAASKKSRRALKELFRSTGEGRNAEVLLAWVREQRPRLSPEDEPGYQALCRELEERRDEGYAQARRQIEKRFPTIERKLRPRLSHFTVRLDEPGRRFADALVEQARLHADEVFCELSMVASPRDEAQAHRGRIACKRLRYLLEPVRPVVDDARDLVKACKRLQDVLGDLNDAAVLAEELGALMERLLAGNEPGTDDPRRPGLLSLGRLNRARIDERFERLSQDWLTGGLADLRRRTQALADTIQQGSGPGLEIERKFLLEGLPEVARTAPSSQIEQGWLPGTKLRERLRRRVRDGEEQRTRTLKLGSGLKRIEVEEDVERGLFDALWPLTEGCRIRKRRYVVDDGDRVWEIDDFEDRSLVLAEIELPHESTAVELPGWLEPYVVRDVTGESEYVNLNLAR